MRPSGADHPSAPPGAQDLGEVPSVRVSVDIALPSLAQPAAICEQDCRFSACARGCVGCGSTAAGNRPQESQEPSLRGSVCGRLFLAAHTLPLRSSVCSLGPDRGCPDVLPTAAPTACPPGHRRPPDASASRSARRPSTPWPSGLSHARTALQPGTSYPARTAANRAYMFTAECSG